MNRRLIQWQRLWFLALCATSAAWADGCGGLPAGPKNGRDYWPDARVDGRAPGVYRLQPKPGGPAFRITVTTLEPSWGADAVPVHAGDIEVARCQDGKQIQQFPIMAWQPINFGLSFDTTDINFDGYRDFSVLTEYAAGWKARAYWVYDPASQRFVKNELTHAMEVDLKGYLVEIDPKLRQISAGILAAFNACAGGEPDIYTVKNNRLILVHKVEVQSYANQRCTKKVWNMNGGVLRITSEQRVDSEGDPVGPNDVPPPVVVKRPEMKLLPVTQPPLAPGTLLFEYPLDTAQGGLLSNVPSREGTGRTQVGAERFTIPAGATVTGLRWYGNAGCLGGPGASQPFKIAFFADQNGRPRGQPAATAEVQALVHPTASVVTDGNNQYQVLLYAVDSLPPLTIPQGRGWLVIQGSGSCGFFWDRSITRDSESGLYGLAYADPARYSEWGLLEDHLAFSLYGTEGNWRKR